MKFDSESLKKHIELLFGFIQDLQRYQKTVKKSKFLDSKDLQYQVLYPLAMSIQSCIDIGNHIIAERGFRRPENYSDIFKILKETKIIDEQLSKSLQKAAKARNLFIHQYWRVDAELIFNFLMDDLKNIQKFAVKIVKNIT